MYIFNKYDKSFNFKNKNQLESKDFNFINYNFNFKNNIIHSILFVISLNLYFYLFSIIEYKYSFKSLISFNPFLLFFISKKSFQKILFV